MQNYIVARTDSSSYLTIEEVVTLDKNTLQNIMQYAKEYMKSSLNLSSPEVAGEYSLIELILLELEKDDGLRKKR